MSYSRVVQTDDAINVKLSQTGRRAAIAADVKITVESTNRVLTNMQNQAHYGQSLSERESKVLPIVRFTTLAKKYEA